MSVPPSPRLTTRGPTPPQSPALALSSRHLSTSSNNNNQAVQTSVQTSSSNSSSNQIVTNHSSSSYINEVELPFTVRPGDRIANKYEVLCLIGRGTFSSVYGCRVISAPIPSVPYGIHHTNPYIPHSLEIGKHDQIVAMKVVRDVDRYRKAAEREIALLELMKKQPNLSKGCVELVDYFLWSNRYVCMVFPLHGSSLYDFLYRNHFLPFFPSQLQQIAKQVCQNLANLHEMGIVHADLKPENIILLDSAYDSLPIAHLNVHIPQSTGIKFIDFGTAILNSNTHKPKIVASRSYRPLEVIFETGWSYGVDIWSAGCILYELYTGIRLFNLTHTCTDMDHLRMMETVLGPIPAHLKQKSFMYAHQIITPFEDDTSSVTNMAISPSPSTHHGISNNMNSTILLQLASQQSFNDNNSNNNNSDEMDHVMLSSSNTNQPSSSRRNSMDNTMRKMSMSSSTSSSSNSSSTSSAPCSPQQGKNDLIRRASSTASTTTSSTSSSPCSSSSRLSPSSPMNNNNNNCINVRLADRILKEDHLLSDLIQKMLAYDPNDRITAKQALQHPYFLS